MHWNCIADQQHEDTDGTLHVRLRLFQNSSLNWSGSWMLPWVACELTRHNMLMWFWICLAERYRLLGWRKKFNTLEPLQVDSLSSLLSEYGKPTSRRIHRYNLKWREHKFTPQTIVLFFGGVQSFILCKTKILLFLKKCTILLFCDIKQSSNFHTEHCKLEMTRDLLSPEQQCHLILESLTLFLFSIKMIQATLLTIF